MAGLATSALAVPPTVLQPADDFRTPGGHDFATQELGDPWDFDLIEDTFTPHNRDLGNPQINGGIFSFDTTDEENTGTTKAQLWLIHPGLQNAQRLVNETREPGTGRRVYTREKFPIDPSFYRYLTLRIRYSSAGAPPLESKQTLVAYYFEDETSIGNAQYGGTTGTRVEPNEWTIVQFDLWTDVDEQYTERWSELSRVEGLRVDPASVAGVHVEIDWIRLTPAPDPANEFTVHWNGNGASTYTVSARRSGDNETAPFMLAEVAGNLADVALDALPPGDYRIEVSGDGESDTSGGLVAVNEPPLIRLTAPDIRGDQSKGYGLLANSNAWSAIDAGDIEEILDFESHRFDNPVGTFYGRPVGSTSRLLMNTPVPIDTAYYRMLCFESEILGQRDIGGGSVTKILWGNKRSILTTPSPVIAHEGLNEYCVGDMAQLRIDPFSPPEAENAWIGPIDHIRFDPHEFQRESECNQSPSPEACRDVRFASMILAPFHRANPNFVFSWDDSDADDNAVIEIFLDDDRIPGNTASSVEHQVAGGLRENLSTDTLDWTPPGSVADGLWNVYARINDGWNEVTQYASGPLLVGAPSSAQVSVSQPDGVDDDVLAGPEYGLDERRNQWDMDGQDINLDLAKNITGISLANGILSGTTVNKAAQFILMSTDEGDPAIDPGKYRYLNVKLRISGVAGPHFVQPFFSDDPGFDPQTAGFAEGIPIDADTWSFISFDLLNGISNASPATWTDFSVIESIRLDPTNTAGADFEIDWVTLSASQAPNASYTVRWVAENTGTSTFDVHVSDGLGHSYNVATGLAPSARQFTFSLAHLPLGQYFTEVVAVPGPVDLSSGAVSLVDELNAGDVLFSSGFED